MKKLHIPILVIIACIVMGIVDAVIQPGYAIKSAIKIIMFLLIPIVYEYRGPAVIMGGMARSSGWR